MNARSLVLRLSRTRLAAVSIEATAAILLCTPPASAAWERFHGDGANRGFVDVATAPAGKGSLSVPGLGTFAPGSGPVVAPDGTVYLGTLEGKLIALRADGRPFWSRDITPGQSIQASPAVGSDGSIYVVGVSPPRTIRDHRGGKNTRRTVVASTLHKFTSSGGWVGQTPFPDRAGGGATTAAPNIVRVGGREVVLVPAVYRLPPATIDKRLIAFSADGGVLFDQRITVEVPSVSGGAGDFPWLFGLVCLVPPAGPFVCLMCSSGRCDYTPPVARGGPPPPPLPGVAVFTFAFAGGDPPRVIATDQRRDVVGYTVSTSGLTESSRAQLETRRLISPPLVLPDGDTLVGSDDGAVVLGGLSMIKSPPVTGLGPVYGTPTQTVSGLVAVVGAKAVALLRDAKILSRVPLPAPSYTSAAASRTHVFVSTTDALLTFDAEAQAPLRTFDWVGGGRWPPAIGPQGHVYAIASNILFVFPPP